MAGFAAEVIAAAANTNSGGSHSPYPGSSSAGTRGAGAQTSRQEALGRCPGTSG
jgi:hypothetical protein